MKSLCIVLLLLFHSADPLRAGGEVSPMLSICRNIELSLHEEFLSKGRELPKSLNEIDSLKSYAVRVPQEGMLLNEMSVVPGAPPIVAAQDIARHHINWRIFAIGRTVNTDYESRKTADGKRMPGRYSVWISPDGSYCSPGWTPETEVQAVFNQIGGFDPQKQPLAFPDSKRRVNDQRAQKVREDRESKRLYDQHRKNKARPEVFGMFGAPVAEIPGNAPVLK